ncbi:diguanylate cyclase [Pseudoalteromonas sp. MTN2-4]|uniref:diguanylate cyclase n=1 Tax=Pseudoalteromonas sp. MTN2-4 TaxID=3056555 RepID=UPI0036F20F0C
MTQRPFVYADINCPFCFVLHERLKNLDLINEVEWRLVEHASSANVQELKYIDILNAEFKAVLDKAPDIEIHNPKFMVNSSMLNETLNAVSGSYPDKALEFRDALYRALWIESLDISDPKILDSLLVKYGVDEFEFSEQQQAQQLQWQSDWEKGEFGHRVPVLVNGAGDSITGLQNESTLRSFFKNEAVQHVDQYSACNLKFNEKVFMLGNSLSSQVVSSYLSHAEYDFYKLESKDTLLSKALKQNSALILVEHQADPDFEFCKQFRAMSQSTTPVIYYSDKLTDEIETQGFAVGVSDMLDVSRQKESLLGRLAMHIRTKHQLDIISGYATHDALTGFYNRREIERVLQRSWQTACRYSTELTVFLIDVDDLKKYNLKYGYAAGDEALMGIANVLSAGRSEDIVGRFSGEEFVMILHNTPEKELLKIANRIQNNILSRKICYNKNDDNDFVTVSIGIATTLANKAHNYTDLLALADTALHETKTLGRNQAIKLILA